MKTIERTRAIELFRQGHPYSYIAKQTGVSKGTLSIWLRDLELTLAQKQRLAVGRAKSRYAGAKAQQARRIARTIETIEEAKKEFLFLTKKSIFLSGLCLYWAEGDKNKQERVKFSNSDPAMIALIMRWLREICRVPENKFRVGIHVHNLLSRKDVERYWSGITGIQGNQFHKTFVKRSTLRQRRNILYNGTCTIWVYDKNLFRRIAGWRLAMIEYLGISSNYLPVVQRIERGVSNP